MTHESDNTFSGLSLVELVQLLSHFGYVGLSILKQRHTQLQRHASQIAVVEVAVSIVGEVLDVVDHASVLLTRNHLQRLYDDLRVAYVFVSEGIEPEVRSIVVACHTILTSSSTVDADSR